MKDITWKTMGLIHH